MPEMTEKAPLKKQHRKKNRETHNAVERHRKKKINAGINRIGELIPCSPALKQSKNMILDQAYKYITEMKKQNDELLLNGGNNEQAEEIKKLRKQLEELQKENGRYIALLKANDICLYDDPTIHWKGNLKSSNVSIVIPNDQAQKKKENLKNTNIPVVIPSDQLQKNIIVYSNGSHFGGSSQGAPVQGRTFNLNHNLQKQTANVVPVQRSCSTPATISNIYSTAVKSGVQTSVSSLASGLPNPGKETLQQSTSENKQGVPTYITTASSVNTVQPARMLTETQSSSQEDNDISKPKNIQESLRLIEKASVPSLCLPSSVGVDVLHCHLVDIAPEESSRSGSLESCATSAADANCTPSAKQTIDGNPPAEKVFRSPDGVSGSKAPVEGEVLKIVTEFTPLPATSVEKWPFPSFSGVGIPDTKSMGGLMRITSAGNTQTTWTTLQLAGSTIPPLSHTPSNIMTALLNEPVSSSSIVTSCPNKVLTNSTALNNPVVADEQTADQMVITLPSYPSLPVQPLLNKAQSRAQMAGSILPMNSATQVIQVSQPISSLGNTPPINQNIVILQTPNANSCPPVLRAELPNQTVSQQIVIIQTANPNPLSLFSTPSSVKVSVNGANASNLMQSASGPHMFGGKHLVHILPRPSSSPSSCLTQTFSVAMSNQKLPQTISLNGQLFALKPMKSCSGDSDQTPMQIIQPTTSEDPNTNIALNTFGALANLNQSISQIAGQSCLQVSLNQPTIPKNDSSQTTPINPVQIPAPVAPSSAAGNSLLTSTSTSLDVSSPQTTSDLGSKWSNKNSRSDKCLVTNNSLACEQNPSKECRTTDGKNIAALSDHSGSDILLENMPVVLQCLALPQGNCTVAPNDVDASDPHPKDRPRSKQDMESTLTPDLNAAVVPRSLSLESSLLGQFEVVAPISTDCAAPSLQICKSQANSATNSKLTELSKCISSGPLITAASDSRVKLSQISETSVSSRGANAERVPRTEVSEICRMEQNCSIVMQASDLLEEQGLTKMFSEFSKVGEVQKTFPVQVEHPSFCSQSKKSNISNDHVGRKQEGLLLMNTEEESLAPSNSCTSEQEAVTTNRQTDSPMSTSSGSSCGFSVASMLPDTCRENVSNSTLVNTHSNCTFSEQTDIVALAARAIFDQETLAKNTGTVSGTSASKDGKVASLGRDQPFKSHIVKNTNQIEAVPNSFSTQNPMQINIERPAEKTCSVGLEMSGTSLQISMPQSSSTSSLSINNLIHQTCIIHPPVSCSDIPSPSSQTPVSVTQSMPSNSYMTQSPCNSPALIADYPSEQLSALQTSTVPGPQMCETHLKQQRQESRKESAKRSVQDDHLLSTSKRQKQCQPAPLQLEDMSLMTQRASDLEDQNRIRVNQIPPNSSNLAVSVSSQGHTNNQSRLFQPTSFVSPTLRHAEVQCNSHSSLSDQAGQHLQPVQHSLTQGMAHLQANHPYIKQQQHQAGQLRERHQLYQLQHHISPAENSIHSQAHIVHQQRVLHQEAQLQKKRTLIQATQPTTHALQKHHASDQSRSKNSQPHPHQSQIQQMQQQYTSSQPEKNHENPGLSRTHSHPRSHPNQDILHQQSSDMGNRQAGSGLSSEHVPGHSHMHRLLTSRALEQQMVSQSSIVTRPDITCLTHRQERNRVSSYSAEALIGKSSSNSEHRLGISIQSLKVSDHLEMRNYADVSRNKDLVIHNTQSCISVDHTVGSDIQRLSECQSFKLNGINQQSTGNFDVQSSRSSELSNSLRGMQTQSFRLAQNAGLPVDRQKRLSYQPAQSISSGNPLPPRRDNENTCHQGFMQSLLVPHLGDQANGSQRPVSEHQRNPQCVSSSNVDYNCAPTRESIHIRREGDDQNRESCDMSLGTLNTRNNSLNIPFSSSSGDIQGRNSSPNISIQKSNPMRITESHGTKAHINSSVSTNVHGAVRPLHYAPVSRSNVDQVPPPVRHTNSSASDRSRHPLQDNGGSKIRQPERNRSANQRHGNVFDPSLPLSTTGGMILGRQQPTIEKRGSTVRFMPEGPQVSNDSTAADQHSLSQNFGFSFIPESGMNPPVNANTSFIPPVTQSNASRTAALIPVDPQNTLPSFYPPYSPAHPTLSNDISIPYFSNQMFSNPGTEKPNGGSLNNRFGSILSPPRPVGFAQPSFPLLADMPPMHMANSSHLSNFNLTSLFPEIATALPSDGSAISPLLSIANTSAADSSKQSSNRPAHNISHILGHDCSSAV